MKKISRILVVASGVLALAGCAERQSTPSMMNTSMPRVVDGAAIKEIPVAEAGDGYLYKLASDFDRYGEGQMRVSISYDPNDKAYDSMRALDDLARIKGRLRKFGVRGISGETMRVAGMKPTLNVSYDSAQALAPEGCRTMPGLENSLTTEQIGDYRFGCSVDSIVAQQIYRPADLKGRSESDPIDGRRAAYAVEDYRTITQEEADVPLSRMQREDISGGSE